MISNNEEKALNKVICKIVTILSRGNILNATIWPLLHYVGILYPIPEGPPGHNEMASGTGTNFRDTWIISGCVMQLKMEGT